MKIIKCVLFLVFFLESCTTQKNLTYFNNLPLSDVNENFPVDLPGYKVKPGDILYISIKGILADGTVNDFLSPFGNSGGANIQTEAGQFINGYAVSSSGEILIPVLGRISITDMTIEEVKTRIQEISSISFKNSIVDCKLLNFKFTIIGEVKVPGTYYNYNNYLNILEALGRAGGVNDYGDRSKIVLIRTGDKSTKTFKINLHDKSILSSSAYYVYPNDVIIVEPLSKKSLNLNLPVLSFLITAITSAFTTTILLINYLK